MKSLKKQAGFIGDVFGAILGANSANRQTKSNERVAMQGFEEARNNLILGNEMDLQNQKDMYDFRLGRMRGAGLTPVEMFGSPASGAGGGTTGSGATLGNAASSLAQARMQQSTQANTAYQIEGLKAITNLAQTKMETDASKEVAGISAEATTDAADISAGATRYSVDINAALKARDLTRLEKELNQVKIPQLAADLKISEQELRIKMNEVATSDPKFVKMLQVMKMGKDNVLTQFLMERHNVDITDGNAIRNMSKKQKMAFVQDMAAYNSIAFQQVSGIREATEKYIGDFDQYFENLGNNIKSGVSGAASGMQNLFGNFGSFLGNQRSKQPAGIDEFSP